MAISLIERTCPLCRTTEHSKCFAEANFDFESLNAFAFASRKLPEYMHYRLLECGKCDLLYACPVPSPEFLAGAYQAADYDSPQEARFASRTYARVVSRALGSGARRDAALDIGTGEGSFLEELLGLGFKRVVGVEPSAAPIAAAKPEIRPLIVQDMFRDGLFEAQSFDLITCFQTIEHLSDPLAFCQSAAGLLRPGGTLILVGHNRRALSARLMGRKSPIFDIEHLQLFSPASAQRLFELAGLSNIRVHRVFNRYPVHYWAKLFPLPKGLKQGSIAMLKAARVGYLPIPLPAGNMATVGFKSA